MTMTSRRQILANVHIEKAAGQTFISILEKKFTYKHCRVKPFRKSDMGIFTAHSMRMLFRINPFVEAISGHSIKPYSDLEAIVPMVRYITLMREPVARYISHYQYWIEKMGKSLSFGDFLCESSMHNFQTKKVAGLADIDKAKQILREKFFLVGIVEEFDDFLRVLQHKLHPQEFDIAYQRKNVGNSDVKAKISKNTIKYEERIVQNNSLDIELYAYAKNYLFQKEKSKFIESKGLDGQETKRKEFGERRRNNGQLWKLYRNLYYAPIVKVIRFINGLPPTGSY